MTAMKSICVYCGASYPEDPKLKSAIERLAQTFSDHQIHLVYGGGSIGVMGAIANEVLARGGTVTGVIPQFLLDREVGHFELTELIITNNMHERKQKMADLSDGFIVLPGGYGTMEEFFEVLTWLQLELHQKPIGVLNVDGFYDYLFAQLDVMVDRKFLSAHNRSLVINESEPRELVQKMMRRAAQPDDEETWAEDRDLS